jgi:hypothetical protein
MESYFRGTYLEHIKKNPTKTPAPLNFWPDLIQFYLCNPILTFNCVITEANTAPKFNITHYVQPEADRSKLDSVPMLPSKLTPAELSLFFGLPEEVVKPNLNKGFTYADFLKLKEAKTPALLKKTAIAMLSNIDERMRELITLRVTRAPKELAAYSRKAIK